MPLVESAELLAAAAVPTAEYDARISRQAFSMDPDVGLADLESEGSVVASVRHLSAGSLEQSLRLARGFERLFNAKRPVAPLWW